MNPEEREELASLYVLGLLEGDELAAFERILAADPELVALVGELENASTILAMSVPQQRTPEALRDSVLSRIKQEDQTSVPLPAPQAPPEPARRPAVRGVAKCPAEKRLARYRLRHRRPMRADP